MNILFMTLPVTLLLVFLFIIIFLASIRSDQFEDLETPAHVMLMETESKETDQNNVRKKDDT